jgi:hypothetical protein
MTRAELEHLIAAAASIADDQEIIVIGSQAILGQFPEAPAELLRSMEADVWPRNHPERWELVDGSIGELSPFHEAFGYYAQGVGPETATLPEGWQDRLVPVSSPLTRGAVGLCLEVHDLVVSKYAAGRQKDRDFVRAALRHGLADPDTLVRRIAATRLEPDRRALILGLIERDRSELTAGRR